MTAPDAHSTSFTLPLMGRVVAETKLRRPGGVKGWSNASYVTPGRSPHPRPLPTRGRGEVASSNVATYGIGCEAAEEA